METKHTKGPWTVGEGSSINGEWEDGTEVQVCLMSTTRWTYGSPNDPRNRANNKRISAETPANAVLVAAAPELLEACEQLLRWFTADVPGVLSASELLLGGCPNELKADIERCRAAIAKATGGTP